MPKFGKRSLENLNTCHEDWQKIAFSVIQVTDFSVIEGHRIVTRQREHFEAGRSKVRFGRHNTLPSLAVHFMPYWTGMPRSMDSIELWRWTYLAGRVLECARAMMIGVRWGGNWDRDATILTDQSFDDLAHFELVGGDYDKLFDQEKRTQRLGGDT